MEDTDDFRDHPDDLNSPDQNMDEASESDFEREVTLGEKDDVLAIQDQNTEDEND